MGGVVATLLGGGLVLLLAAAPARYELTGSSVFGVGTGIVALTLGVRHAFDADHIAAIDNTTRSLQRGPRRALGVGFFFSLGHSSVVLVLTVLLSAGLRTVGSQIRDGDSVLHAIGNIVGTLVSGGFLYLIAAVNLVSLVNVVRVLRRSRHQGVALELIDGHLDKRGLLVRILRSRLARVDRLWKVYPVGVLFGLGFDTATEISLLVLSGSAVSSGLPVWAVLSLPLLFAGGMCLFDTLDGCVMAFAYDWARLNPIRKVRYNLVVTALSIVFAVGVATIELFGLAASRSRAEEPLAADLTRLDSPALGLSIVSVLVVGWLVGVIVWHLRSRQAASEK